MELNRDPTQALTQVMAKVNQVRYKLPEQAYDPVIELSSGESTAVAYVGFSSEQISIPELTDYLSRVVEPMFSLHYRGRQSTSLWRTTTGHARMARY